jgi:hypothetical protein
MEGGEGLAEDDAASFTVDRRSSCKAEVKVVAP